MFFLSNDQPRSPIASSSFLRAFFSMRDTDRIGYCKRLALRKSLRLTEAKMDDDLFVLGQFYPLNQADKKLPV